MNIYIEPKFRGRDAGEGGIRRVVEAQHRWLPEFGFNIVDRLSIADIVATHAGSMVEVPVVIPWVCHTHGLYWSEYEWPRWCQRLNQEVIDVMRQADHVTAPSEWVAQALRRGMWLRPTVLHHGVEPEEWESDHIGDYVLWNKNRTDPVCDPSVVDVLATIESGVKFVTTFGIKRPNVTVTGRLGYEEGKDWVKNAGVYLATTRETFGIGTLEAMAAGVPVVGWAWGGQKEIIEQGVTGWLVPPGDHDGLLEGIKWALANRDTVGAAARADVLARWTWRQAIERYVALYRQLIERAEEQRQAPKVSIIIPCYNLAKYLPDTIASLQDQSMADWEAIIVDDASPDNTPEVAAELCRDERVRVIRNDPNLYLAGSLNAGIAQARGRYIIPVDADNMIAHMTLKELSDALDKDRGIHIAYGACQFVLEDGKQPDVGVSPNGVSPWPTDFSFRAQMLHRNQIPSTCMYRKEVWERSGGYRRRCRTGEDAEFWTRAVSIGFKPEKVTNSVTLIYRQRPESMSRIEADWDWTAWFPWSLRMHLVPFGAAAVPPPAIGMSWPVPNHEMPVVSVVIPVGPGHEDLLIDALDSVEAQTFREWETIVVNDTGHPLVIPHSWARVIDTEGGLGPAAARNIGIAAAKTPAIVPLDADDLLQPEALNIMYQVWEDEDREAVIYSQWWDDKGDKVEIYDPDEYDAADLISKGCIHAVTAMYPKSAWEAVGGFDEGMVNWEDWDLQLALAAEGICGVKISLPLWTYRKTTGTRRRENYDAFERGKEAILAKWSRFWDGEEELMACRGCSGRRPVTVSPPPLPSAAQALGVPSAPTTGTVLLEYIAPGPSRTFRGPVTRTNYRFGSDDGHRQKYVLAPDVPHLLQLAGLFRVVGASELLSEGLVPPPQQGEVGSEAAPTLNPLGPPRQEAPAVPEVEPDDEQPPEESPVQHVPLAEDVPSISALRRLLPDLDKERVAVMLSQEKAGSNRATAVTLLQRALAR